VPLPSFTDTSAVKTGGPKQKVSVGPESLKVIVPVGLNPPIVAVSWMLAPTGAVMGVAVVANPVGNLPTITVSLGAPQGVGPAGLLLASPLYETTHR
jgi:hypothetical protein